MVVANTNTIGSQAITNTDTGAKGADGDFLFYPSDESSAHRFLGHKRASYGFILDSPTNDLEGFVFPLPPQSLDQDEEAAVTIIPTQGGGKYIENRGNIFKDITISGTTGFLPRSNINNMGGDKSLLGYPEIPGGGGSRSQVEQAASKVSGYVVFHTLRSMFRKYWLAKRQGSTAERLNTRLYFVNTKDNEMWLVEPMMFRMPRSSKSPLGYQYQIRLRTIEKGFSGVHVPDDITDLPDPVSDASAFMKFLSDIITAIQDAVNKVVGFLNMVTDTVMSYVNTVLDVANVLINGLTAITSASGTVLSIPKSIVNKAVQMIDNAFDAAGALLIDLPTDLVDGLTTMRQQFDNVLAQPSLFAERWQDKWAATLDRFNAVDQQQAATVVTGFANAPLRPISTTNKHSKILTDMHTKDETIHSFVAKRFGNLDRLQEIIAINNLKFPYFVSSKAAKTDGTLAPGDPVLVPSDGLASSGASGTQGFSPPSLTESDISSSAGASSITKLLDTNPWRANQWTGYAVQVVDGTGAGQLRKIVSNDAYSLTVDSAWTTIPSTSSLFEIFYSSAAQAPSASDEDLYGVDILVDSTGDFTLSSSGDIQTVGGLNNFIQALDVKMKTERRELLLHQWFGMLMSIGVRGTPESLFATKFDAERTLLSDSRVSAVQGMSVSLNKDVYQLKAYVVPKGTKGAMPITKAI